MPRIKKRAKHARTQRRRPADNRRMDQGALAWMINYARQNLWRVTPLYGLDDLIQEGHWCWQYVITHYPQARKPAHLMALFKLACHSHFTTLARKRTKDQDAVANYTAFLETSPEILEPEHASFAALLRSAPEPIRKVLELYVTNPRKVRRSKHRRVSKSGKRETTTEFYSRLIGVPRGMVIPRLAEEIQEYFSP
jgi:hypothetical protein